MPARNTLFVSYHQSCPASHVPPVLSRLSEPSHDPPANIRQPSPPITSRRQSRAASHVPPVAVASPVQPVRRALHPALGLQHAGAWHCLPGRWRTPGGGGIEQVQVKYTSERTMI
jgi:hypothetical protein